MDFEEFRKKKKAAQEQQAQQEAQQNAPTAAGGKLDWIDGMGPAGYKNPKVKGFVLGRFKKAKVDPKDLQRPAGYEATARTGPAEVAQRSPAELELEKRRAALAKAEADLAAAEQKRLEAEIDARKKKEGIDKPRGMTKY